MKPQRFFETSLNQRESKQMRWSWLACLVLATSARAEGPPAPTMAPGQEITLRIRQVIPVDGLSPGERLLNGRPEIQPGDHFLAEVLHPETDPPALLGGSITKITPPGWFGRPGYLTLQIAQLVQTIDGQVLTIPWQVDTEDRSHAARMRRMLLTALFGLEGAGTGAAIGAELASPAPGQWLQAGTGAGIGVLVGLGYASLQRGTEASLEPGDTFHMEVGNVRCQPVPRNWQTILYPAPDSVTKGKHP